MNTAGYSFFGVQGAWYTVGYRMAVIVERREGRPALVECMSDPNETGAHSAASYFRFVEICVPQLGQSPWTSSNLKSGI